MRKLIFSMLLMLPLLAAAAEPATMVLEMRSGIEYEFLLEDGISITYSGSDMILDCNDISSTFALNEVYRFYFTGDLTGTAGVSETPVAPALCFKYVAPNVYEISGEDVKGVTVVNTAGLVVVSLKAEGGTILDLNNLENGIYLATVDLGRTSQTIKITKK